MSTSELPQEIPRKSSQKSPNPEHEMFKMKKNREPLNLNVLSSIFASGTLNCLCGVAEATKIPLLWWTTGGGPPLLRSFPSHLRNCRFGIPIAPVHTPLLRPPRRTCAHNPPQSWLHLRSSTRTCDQSSACAITPADSLLQPYTKSHFRSVKHPRSTPRPLIPQLNIPTCPKIRYEPSRTFKLHQITLKI